METLKHDIKSELIWFLVIFVIVTWSLMAWDIKTRYDNRDEILKNWEYNLDPQPGSGWIDAAIGE